MGRRRQPPKVIAARQALEKRAKLASQKNKSIDAIQAMPSKEQRVMHVIGMMARCEWVPVVTQNELAAKWCVTPKTVAEDAAEASRHIKFAVQEQRDGMAETFIAACDERIRSCLERKQEREALGWATLKARVAGLEITRVETAGTLGDLLAEAHKALS